MRHLDLRILIQELRKAREEEGVTQYEVARRMGARADHVYKWESFYITPGANSLFRWAEALGYEFDMIKVTATQPQEG